jgi:hypothetical protein
LNSPKRNKRIVLFVLIVDSGTILLQIDAFLVGSGFVASGSWEEVNMACPQREKTGTCIHRQCGFPEHSGYNCVDIAGGYCECGEGCYKKCSYAYKQGDEEKNAAAMAAFEKKYG